MNNLTRKLGYWSALISASTFVIWIICFVGIVLTSPLFQWTNFSEYLDYITSNSQFFQYLAKSFMLIFSLSFIVLIISLGEMVEEERKILSKIGIMFGICFTLLSSIHYYAEVSSVRWAINDKLLVGIDHFIQANPTSFSSAQNMLGWTLFLGLCSLFMAFALEKGRKFRIIRISLIVNGISCLLAGLGYITQTDVITFLFINLFVGGSLLVFTISFARIVRSGKI